MPEREEKKLDEFEKNYSTMGSLQSENNIRMLNGKLRSDLRRSLKKLAKQKQITRKYGLEQFSFPDSSIETMKSYNEYIDEKGLQKGDLRPKISYRKSLTKRINSLVSDVNALKSKPLFSATERKTNLAMIAKLQERVDNLEIEALDLSDSERSNLKRKLSQLKARIADIKNMLKTVSV